MIDLVIKAHYTRKEPDGRGGWRYHYDAAAVRRLHQAIAEAGFAHLDEAIAAHRHGTDPRLRRLPAKYRAQLADPPQSVDSSDPDVAAWYHSAGVDTGHADHPAQQHLTSDRSYAAPTHARQERMALSRTHKYLYKEMDDRGRWRYAYAYPKAVQHTPKLAEQVDRFERAVRMVGTREYGIALTPDGEKIADLAGSDRHLAWSPADCAKMRGGIMSHNHPTGKTFSLADVQFMVRWGLREIRAVTKDGRYSLRAAEQPHPRDADYVQHKYRQFQRDLLDQVDEHSTPEQIRQVEARALDSFWKECAGMLGWVYTHEPWPDNAEKALRPQPLLLIKARRGWSKPGHKYISRTRGADGKFDYTYERHHQGELFHGDTRMQSNPHQHTMDLVARSPEELRADALDRVERSIRHLDHEVGVIVDDDGTEIARLGQGNRALIELSIADMAAMRGKTFTHNHPRMPEGTSFSPTDVRAMLDSGAAECRVVGGHYRYRITNPGNLTWDAIERDVEAADYATRTTMMRALRANTITVHEANLTHTHMIWTSIAEQYGMTYSREEWSDSDGADHPGSI